MREMPKVSLKCLIRCRALTNKQLVGTKNKWLGIEFISTLRKLDLCRVFPEAAGAEDICIDII
jgi:hypothetical protein